MKTLDSLPQDIDDLFTNGAQVNEANLKAFTDNIAALLKDRLTKREDKGETLRMSRLGTPDRKLWFEHNLPLPRGKSTNALKFIYGDIIEQLIIFLAKETGHKVEHEQQEVIIDGIVGHQDGTIDGVTIDVKSASSFAFNKFAKATLFKDDPFGYIAQLSSYKYANNTEEAAFIGVNKESGNVCILPLDNVDTIDPVQRIKEVKSIIVQKEPPLKKCYEPVQYKTTNNKTLHKNCTYCPYAHKCWADVNNGKGLRYFNYSTGPVAFTEVVDTPRVEELFPNEPATGEVEVSTEEII